MNLNKTLTMKMKNTLDHIVNNACERQAIRWEHWTLRRQENPDLTLLERITLRRDYTLDTLDDALISTVQWLQHNYQSLLQITATVLCVMFACSTVVTLASLAYGNGDMFVLSLFVTLITGAIYSTTETTIINK